MYLKLPFPKLRNNASRGVITLLLLIVAATGISQTKAEIREAYKNREKYLFAVRPEQKNFVETIPFTTLFDEMFINVEIAGKPYNFLFDTGALTLISNELQRELNLEPVMKTKMIDGAGVTGEGQMYMLDKLKAGAVSFGHVGASAVDLREFDSIFCVKLDGIFGTNMMRTCNWKIDYANKTLTFSDKKIKPDFEADEIDFEEGFSGSPILRMSMGGIYFSALLDTGKNMTLDIPDSLYFKSKASQDGKFKKGYGKRELTLFNEAPMTEYFGTLDTLQMGKLLFKDVAVRVTPSPMILLGNKFFTNFGQIIIDWHKSKLYLPRGKQPLLEETQTFGFVPQPRDGGIVVVFLWQGSKAKEQGIELGDKILSVNGRDTSRISSAEWCELWPIFKRQGTLEIVVLKNEVEKKFVLESYDLLGP